MDEEKTREGFTIIRSRQQVIFITNWSIRLNFHLNAYETHGFNWSNSQNEAKWSPTFS